MSNRPAREKRLRAGLIQKISPEDLEEALRGEGAINIASFGEYAIQYSPK